MSIDANDIRKLEVLIKESLASTRLCPRRYSPGAAYTGVFRILEIWPDRLKEVEMTDGEWRENAVTYLEVDPFYFRSGYDKAELLRHLKRAQLSGDHKRRLRKVVLTSVEKARSVEFRQYCQLATRLATQGMLADLAKLCGAADTLICRRARWMQAYVEKGMKEAGTSAKAKSDRGRARR